MASLLRPLRLRQRRRSKTSPGSFNSFLGTLEIARSTEPRYRLSVIRAKAKAR